MVKSDAFDGPMEEDEIVHPHLIESGGQVTTLLSLLLSRFSSL